MNRFRDAPAGWTRIARLRAVDIEFVGHAVLSGIRSFIDEAVIPDLPEQLLHTLRVALLRRADEIVVRDSHPLPQCAKLARDFVGILLRRFPSRLRRTLNLLSVFVGASQEECVIA